MQKNEKIIRQKESPGVCLSRHQELVIAESVLRTIQDACPLCSLHIPYIALWAVAVNSPASASVDAACDKAG